MRRTGKKQSAGEKRMASRLFEELYSQEEKLPAQLEGRVSIVSCLSWKEEQRVYLTADEQGRLSILKWASGDSIELLLKEAENLEHARFSFVPRIYAWKAEADGAWLHREYIQGDTLWEIVERDGPYEKEKADRLVCRICEMAGRLHNSTPPFIHRDLKPQNIVLTPEDNLFLIDMGTVREYREEARHDTVFVGTRATAAPEQYGFRQTDCRTDIYALGVIYLYLLTGELDVRRHRAMASLPEKCLLIIEKCTRLDPQERYQSCRELKQAILETEGIVSSKIKRRKLRKKEALAGGIFGLCSLAVILAGIAFRLGPKAPYQFRSEMIGEAARAALGKEADEPVTKAELASIKSLRICGTVILEPEDIHSGYAGHHYVNYGDENTTEGTISDISDCAYMTGLRTLVLDGQQITDLSPLEGLPLESLSLCDNPISDLTVAASLTNLKFLAIEETDVTDLSPLGELDALTELDIGTIPAADLDSIAGTNIEYLVMNAVPAEHYEALYTLPLKKLVMHSYSADDIDTVSQILTLEQLTIYGYPYNTLEVLLGLTNLKSLDITGGGVRTLEGIEELTALQTLTIGDTQVTDLTPLLQNTKLSYLYITDIPAGDYSVLAQMSRLLQVTCSEAQKEEIEQEIDDLQFQINIQ